MTTGNSPTADLTDIDLIAPAAVVAVFFKKNRAEI